MGEVLFCRLFSPDQRWLRVERGVEHDRYVISCFIFPWVFLLTGDDAILLVDIMADEVRKGEDDPVVKHTTQQLLELLEEEREFIALIGERGKCVNYIPISFYIRLVNAYNWHV